MIDVSGGSDLLEQIATHDAVASPPRAVPEVDDAPQQRQTQPLVVLVKLLHLTERLPQLDIDQLQRPLLILEQARQLQQFTRAGRQSAADLKQRADARIVGLTAEQTIEGGTVPLATRRSATSAGADLAPR